MRKRWVAVARGDEPADLVLQGGTVLSVFTGELFRSDVAIVDGHVVGVGQYSGPNCEDVRDRFLVPGFIDGHCHIESSKLSVEEFSRCVLQRGTTSVVVDPHELANVLGVTGIEYVLAASEAAPLDVYVALPSCVPASNLESSLGPIGAADLAPFLGRDRVIGIAEMMNFPATIAGDSDPLEKMALSEFAHIDGHAPGLTGKALNAYLAAGPSSDHECTTFAEALEKRRLGMWIMIREASMIRNLEALIPLVIEYGTENCMFVTDDREVSTLLHEGHVNSMVRKAVSLGLSPGDAVKLASLNVARYHGLARQGAIAPGYAADILVLDDLVGFEPARVYKRGQVVAESGHAAPVAAPAMPPEVRDTVHLPAVDPALFRIADGGEKEVRVVEIIPGQVVTRLQIAEPARRDGELVSDAAKDLVKVAVVERHHASGRIGLGFVRGLGLRDGAMASTVAHDAHNVVVAGTDDGDMVLCVRQLGAVGGGLAVARGGRVTGVLPLEIAGLMSSAPAEEVAAALADLEDQLRSMGSTLETPFMYLSFLALSVIPEARITDRGLVDVRAFKLVPLGNR